MMPDADNPTDGTPAGGDATMRVQQLFVRHQGIVKAFILSLQPGFADADDVLQETFLVVTRRAADFREGTNFVAWACSIARLKLFEARRKATSPALSEAALNALCDDTPDDSFFQARLGALRECLQTLAPRAKELVWLRYHSELASQEIADRLAWKEPAVRVALSKARVFLRECVQGRLAKGGA
jgi:RNA polymerase sigma-70 factor (ECF subfamily)